MADEMMLRWVTPAGHCQEESIFMLNLQEEMHYICLLVCLFIMQVSYFSLGDVVVGK